MTDRQDDERPEANTRKSQTNSFLVWYEGTAFAHIVRAFSPLVGVFSAAGLVIAILALVATLYGVIEGRKDQEAQEAELFASVMESLEIARKEDSSKSATKIERGKVKCTKRRKQLSARHGQIAVIQKMVKLKISLRDISARNVNLVIDRDRKDESYGINLGGADLENADLEGSNLSKALLSNATLRNADLDKACMESVDLTGADLRGASIERVVLIRATLVDANLTGADLYKANLYGANMANTDLTNANLTGANLQRIKNLTQIQLDSACAESDEEPINLPKGKDGEKLIWNKKECS